jgi:hypothetical protein
VVNSSVKKLEKKVADAEEAVPIIDDIYNNSDFKTLKGEDCLFINY